MAYRLDDLCDPSRAVRRVAQARLQHAAAALADDGGGPESVHTARKDIKKTRSLLRLARGGLPAKHRRALNDELRDIAAALAGTRDADALAAAVEDLAAHADGRIMPEAFVDLAAALRGETTPVAQNGNGLTPPPSPRDGRREIALEAAGRLADAATGSWPAAPFDREALVDGIVRAYDRGYTALDGMRTDASAEALHEWRKRVKDLWYHARLLLVAAPNQLGAIVDDANALSELLGDEHDLSILADRLDAEDPSVAGVVVQAEALRELIDERRDALRHDAAVLAAQLYAETSRAFRRRIHAYLYPRRAVLERG